MGFSGVILAGLFLSELFILFFLSRFLTKSLSRVLYAVTRSRKVTVYLLAIIFLPGTIIHELAHFLSAEMMLVPTGDIDIFPEIGLPSDVRRNDPVISRGLEIIEEKSIRLGSIQVGQTDMVRRFLIGVAPVVVGLGLIFGVLWVMQEHLLGSLSFWQQTLAFYTVFVISNNMFSSKKDMEGAAAFLVAIFAVSALVLGVLYFTGNLDFGFIFRKLEASELVNFFQKVDQFLVVPLGLDVAILGLATVLTGISRKAKSLI